MHKSQIFFFILLAFIAGVFAGSFFNIPNLAVESTALVCAVLIAIFYRRGSRLLNVKIGLAAFLTLFFVLGVVRFNYVNSRQHNLQKFAEAQAQVIDPKHKHPIKVTLNGYIDDEPVVSGSKQNLVFRALKLIAGQQSIDVNERTLITTQLFPEYQYGDKLAITGEVQLPQNFSDFDYRTYLAKDSIFTTVSYPNIITTQIDLPFYEKWKLAVFREIFVFKNSFERSVGRSIMQPNAAFVDGILLGSRSQLPDNIKQDFARTSTSHIIAVSGYNITIIAGIISWFFLLFMRRPLAFWFSIAGIVLFTIMTGAQASVVRAAIMGALVLLANREGRLSSPRNAIVLAGALMVLLNPTILRYDVGFQLSFAATLGLIYVSPIIEKYFFKLPDYFNLRETLIMTASAQIFVLPLLLYYFKSLSVTSLPANIIVLPTIPFAMLLGFVSGIAGMILPVLGHLVGYFAWLLTGFELGVIKILAKPSWAAISIEFKWYMVVAAYVLIVIFLKKLTSKRFFSNIE